MKKLLYSLLIVNYSLFIGTLAPARANPFFGESQNQIMFNFGQGVNDSWILPKPEQPVPFNMLQLAYSQPLTFFRMPSRQTMSFIRTIGYGKKYTYLDEDDILQEWDWTSYGTEMVLLSFDTALLYGKDWYFGAGLSLGMQRKFNYRFGTRIMTGVKLTAGYKLSDRWTTEMFMQHLSNGDTGGINNYAYNFYGIGIGYNF
ncbi:MAG: acyloxyacyl hydrolase [Rickettsiales bacterium]|jgi:hypothetical protein|nr:acyloxyacyl hydrolase [Rickettsiales bacterium]